VAPPPDPDDMEVDPPRGGDGGGVGVEDLPADPGQAGRGGVVFDHDRPALVLPPFLPVPRVIGQGRVEFALFDQGPGREIGLPEPGPQKTEEFPDHKEGVALRVKGPLLGVLTREADVLVEVEGDYPGGVETAPVVGLGQVLVEPGRGVAGGQSEVESRTAVRPFRDILDDDPGRDLAHLVEIPGDDDLEAHRYFPVL
jgi:hypothetical protein